MNIQKPLAFAAAVLITAAGMAGIANYTNAAADVIHANAGATATTTITILPMITVHPARTALRKPTVSAAGKGGAEASTTNDARMPFYSFAADQTGA